MPATNNIQWLSELYNRTSGKYDKEAKIPTQNSVTIKGWKMILLQRFKIHETAKNQLPFLSKLGKFAFQERNGFAK